MKIVLAVIVIHAIMGPSLGIKIPCCGPKKFMASIGATVGQVEPSVGAQGIYTYMYGAYDYTQRTFGFNMTISPVGGNTTNLRIIQKYAENTQWIIMDDIKYCSKQPAEQPEPIVCIPMNASFILSSVIGGEGGLKVDTWTYSYQRPKDPLDGTISLSVVQDSCYPVGASFIGVRYDEGSSPVPFVSSSGVMNMTMGIPDPDKWFTVPSFCNQEDNDISERSRRSIPFLDHFSFPKLY